MCPKGRKTPTENPAWTVRKFWAVCPKGRKTPTENPAWTVCKFWAVCPKGRKTRQKTTFVLQMMADTEEKKLTSAEGSDLPQNSAYRGGIVPISVASSSNDGRPVMLRGSSTGELAISQPGEMLITDTWKVPVVKEVIKLHPKIVKRFDEFMKRVRKDSEESNPTSSTSASHMKEAANSSRTTQQSKRKRLEEEILVLYLKMILHLLGIRRGGYDQDFYCPEG